ncbi:MAG: elongation factor P maturation arginine rhamnosyltransferase EarP [Caldimonas sp.]
MQWDLYCRVVDNHGDIGVAWRLAADLAGRGESVRLAVDDTSALAWIAPQGASGVEIVRWQDRPSPPPDVVVELFGAGRPPTAWPTGTPTPVLLNLEHLSAEPYVERSHGLPSPTRRPGEPASTTWFFYPGFSDATGGLLREPGLLERRRAFGRGDEWLDSIGVAARVGERRVSLFSYRNDAVGELLDALAAAPTLLVLPPGAAAEQVAAILGSSLRRGMLRAVRLPFIAQDDFDHLLWSCQLNFVRGEDSFVRAFWAGAPFVWHLYVQDDGAHAVKLAAFLDRFLAGAPTTLALALRALFARWNGTGGGALAPPMSDPTLRAAWLAQCARWRESLVAQDDLVTRLLRFARAKR